MILSRKLKAAFTKMILFNGSLAFSPNTLNNPYMTYALAKRWEEKNLPYDDWMQLISSLKQFNDDYIKFFQPDPNSVLPFSLFGDWNVEGDGSVYSNFTARAIFDPSNEQPFQILDENKQFSVSSPPGAHKAVMADMDTDSQGKSKIFSLQLVIDEKLSLALQPSSFRNMVRNKYGKQAFKASTAGVDWFMVGNMKLLSHKDNYKFKHQILQEFAKDIQASTDKHKLLQQYILRMNQFNYNYQTKLSFITGYIEPTETNRTEPVPNVQWRTISFPQQKGVKPPKVLYMREVKNEDANIGLLLDLNNLLEVVTGSDDQFTLKDRINLSIRRLDGQDPKNAYELTLTRDVLDRQCGMYFIPGGFLADVSYHAEITYFNSPPSQNVTLSGDEIEFSFQILERFKKTKHIGEGISSLNVERFAPYIEYDFRCMRFGKNISPQEMAKIESKVTLTVGGPSGRSLGDVTGISQYAYQNFEKNLQDALNNNKQFANKYGMDLDIIKDKVFKGKYEMINATASQIQQLIKPISEVDDTSFWKKSQKEYFDTQFNNPDDSNVSQKEITIQLDSNGRGTFKLYLNENLTWKNNPRSLVPRDKRTRGSNPILSSIAIESVVTAQFNRTALKQPISSSDSVSGIYFESNPELGQQYPDWKNYVGPRLRMMALLYPAMQKIINLYSFNELKLDAMKRAFDIEDERHSRYMPSTREISPFEHRMVRRWLYEPYFDNAFHTNINFKKIQAKQNTLNFKQSFKQRKEILRNKLKDAFSFELFTIPLYLTAMYTTNIAEHENIFREVLHDEMKHLFIVSNLINAIREPDCQDYRNGPPYLDQTYVPTFIEGTPTHPRYVYQTSANSNVKQLYSFEIAPLTDKVLLKMIAAEFPSETKSLILKGNGVPVQKQAKIQQVQEQVINAVNNEQNTNPQFRTIGELYAEIVAMLWSLNDLEDQNNKLFSGNPLMQFTYPQLLNMQEIYSLRTALNQIRLIVDEGEGSRVFSVTNQLKKMSHFVRFIEVYTGCKVDEDMTNTENKDNKDGAFIIFFKDTTLTETTNKNDWTAAGQDAKLRQIVEEEMPGTKPYGLSKYTNVVGVEAFNNVYKKILTELHYVFNSNYDNFKKYILKDSTIKASDTASIESRFKEFKFKRMEHAIAKMRQMSLHSRYNIRPEPMPPHEFKAPLNPSPPPSNEGLSVRPNYNVIVEFPEDS